MNNNKSTVFVLIVHGYVIQTRIKLVLYSSAICVRFNLRIYIALCIKKQTKLYVLIIQLVINFLDHFTEDEPQSCNSKQWACSTGKCIDIQQRCDLHQDCLYGDDEKYALCGMLAYYFMS